MATYSTEMRQPKARTRCSSTWPPSQRPRVGHRGRGGRVTDTRPGPGRVGLPVGRADRRPRRAVRLPGPEGLDRPRRVVLQATHGHMVSTDTITVKPPAPAPAPAPWSGTYAVLQGQRPAPIGAPLLARFFATTADKGPPGSAPRWHDPFSSLRHCGRGARSDGRRQLQPDRLRRAVCGSTLAPARGPHRPRRRRDRRLIGNRPGRPALELARLGATLWLVGRDKGGSRPRPAGPRPRWTGAMVDPVDELDLVDSDAVSCLRERLSPPSRTATRIGPRRRRALPHVPQCSDGRRAHRRRRGGGSLPSDLAAQPAAAPGQGRHHRDGVIGRYVLPTLRPRSARNDPRELPRHHRLYAGRNGPRSSCPTSGPAVGVPTVWPATRRIPAGSTRQGWPAGFRPSPNSVRCSAHPQRAPTPWSGWQPEGPGIGVRHARRPRGSSTIGTGVANTTCPGRPTVPGPTTAPSCGSGARHTPASRAFPPDPAGPHLGASGSQAVRE